MTRTLWPSFVIAAALLARACEGGQPLTLQIDGIQFGGRCVKFSPTGTEVVVGDNEIARVLDVVSGEELGRTAKQDGQMSAISFSADGAYFATAMHRRELGGDASVFVWDARTLKKIDAVDDGQSTLALDFSSDGRIATGGVGDGTIRIWKKTRKGIKERFALDRTIETHSTAVTALAFSPNGKLLASGGWDRQFAVWDVANGQRRFGKPNTSHRVNAVAFSPNGTLVAFVTHDGVAEIWNVETGAEVATMRSKYGLSRFHACAFSSNDQLVTAGSFDGDTTLVWNLRGERVSSVHFHREIVMGMDFSAQDKLLATYTFGKELKISNVGE